MQTEQEYQARERQQLFSELRDVEAAPLSERREARTEWAEALTDPSLIGERVESLLAGSYGKGAYDYARELLTHKRANVVAQIGILIAALEWRCSSGFARQAWNKLPRVQRGKAVREIRSAIEIMED